MVFRLVWHHCVIAQRILSHSLSIYYTTLVARIRRLWNQMHLKHYDHMAGREMLDNLKTASSVR